MAQTSGQDKAIATLNQINSIVELNPNAILWSSCPHLYSTNGESHVLQVMQQLKWLKQL
jgi:hypothetical protein